MSGARVRSELEEQIMKTRIAETRSIRAGSLALVGMLVIGALTAWMLPADAEARYGGKGAEGWGSNQREPAANSRRAPEKVAPVYDDQPLSETEAEALLAALDDEYKAWATYEQVIDDFGAVQPFTSVQRAEESHIAALVRLLQAYGLEVPENEWEGHMPSFASLAEACAEAAQAEIDNAALYDELLVGVENPRILRVFESLQKASESRHLPAFQRCAA